MTATPETLRWLLTLCLTGLALLAALDLRRGDLSLIGYCMWGLLAIFLPGLGPLLVLLAHPGRHPRKAFPL